MPMSRPARIAWYRNTACIASRTVSLPRNANETLLTPPLVLAPGQRSLIATHRLDEGDAVSGVLLDAGADGEDVGVEDDVFRLVARAVDQQAERALADRHLAVHAVGLALLVEGHHDHRGAVAPDAPRLLEERRLAFLQARSS